MIIFETVRYKNFLMAGPEFIEIKLNDPRKTLILGNNGTGKSTFLDALSYCLYNKSFRDINKPQLINSTTEKNLVVEVEFSIGEVKYLVRRGEKPAMFEIYKNGNLISQDASNIDYQAVLENILHMNYQAFRQIVVLGSANYKPFMLLSAADRRKIVDALLDLEIFSLMFNELKDVERQNKDDLVHVEYQIELQEQLLEQHRKHKQELLEDLSGDIDKKNEQIEETSLETEKLLNRISSINDEQANIQAEVTKLKKYDAKMVELDDIKKKLETQIKAIDKKIVFYEENDRCPTCTQTISEKFRKSTVADLRNKAGSKLSVAEEVVGKIAKVTEYLELKASKLSEMDKNSRAISELSSKVNSNTRLVSLLQKEIKELNSRSKTLTTQSDDEKSILETLELHKTNRRVFLDSKESIAAANLFLKDSGIKATIIRQYLSLINKFINMYLQMMEFPVEFILDEQFRETIRSKGYDRFSYHSFSQGQRLRIDLAILFTWRTVAKLRNAAATNLLVFDEIFEQPFDYHGIDEFTRILDVLAENTSIIIISPKGDGLVDKFENVIRFEKYNGFSRIVEND